jgi:uncharacterized membrane protein YhaH (DUF805 family)
MLVTSVIGIAASILGILLTIALGPQIGAGIYVLISVAVGVYSMWASLASSVKRLHDREKSGWWLLIWYIAPAVLVGIGAVIGDIAASVSFIAALAFYIWMFVELGCLKGTTGPNMYGPDPLPAEAHAT